MEQFGCNTRQPYPLPAHQKNRLRLLSQALVLFLAFPVSSLTSERREAAPQVAFRPGLRLVTLNTAKESDSAKIVRQIDAAPQVRNADVILLQEVAHAPGHR